MILGQTIRAPYNGGIAYYYGPWFPRMGVQAVFACNVIAAASVSAFRLYIESKRSEDDGLTASIVPVADAAISTATPDSVITLQAGSAIDGTGTYGFRDLIRYRYKLTSNASARGWVHFRMLDPTWETN